MQTGLHIGVGVWIESAWDVANIGIDIASLQSNINDRNVGGAIVDGVGLILDLCAAILPLVPGGAGPTIKAIRTVDETSDALKIPDSLKSLGWDVNNEIFWLSSTELYEFSRGGV